MDEYGRITRRTWRRTVVIAVVGLIVGGVAGWLVGHDAPASPTVLATLGPAFALGGLAGGISIIVTSLGISMRMRARMQGLPASARRTVTQAIKTGTPIEPAGSELGWRAFDQARLMAAYHPLAFGQFLLLSLGIVGPQLSLLVREEVFSAWLSRITCSVLVVAAVVLTPLLVRSSRRARRYVLLASA
ncbi:hypothetical protein [Curtobacterium sp. MCBD17_032]|uniref:hypothetical protein n=1 Tax=Curtobacterium sp. MCBD17_032 TaxID=2175659 RepID=UPI000DAA9019|nr:hypothetical protein [Curtobacterium sp. MCBD17_032]PZE80224.1 hypothetical protein DEI91_14720 [Curtobacterium sp. MCBD17_032]